MQGRQPSPVQAHQRGHSRFSASRLDQNQLADKLPFYWHLFSRRHFLVSKTVGCPEPRPCLTHRLCVQASGISPLIWEVSSGCKPSSSLPFSTIWRKADLDCDDTQEKCVVYLLKWLEQWLSEMASVASCSAADLHSGFLVLFLLCVLECPAILFYF